MNSPRLLAAVALAAFAAWPSAHLLAQCTNPTQCPTDPVHPNTDGTVTQIASCSFEEEYSQVTDIYATVTYEFTLGTGNYITVHQGTPDGPVIAQGLSPVQATAVTSE